MQAEGIVPRLLGDQVISLLSPDYKAGNMAIDPRVGISAEEFDQCSVVASRSCRQWIECRQFLKNLLLLLLREVSVPYFVVVPRATRIHDESTLKVIRQLLS